MKLIQSKSKKFMSIMAVFFAVLFGMMANGCGGGGSSTVVDGDGVVPIEAPGVPTNFTVVATPDALLSATLSWSAPTTGDAPTSYEIYRSTTADNILDPANHLISLSATTYDYIDDAGLEYGVTTYWIVVAKNDGGETPTLPADYTFTEPPGVPMNFLVSPSAVGGELSATLSWEPPMTGGEVDTYEIYRSNTVDNVFDPANYLISIQAEVNKTDYQFIDNAGLERGVTTYWTVAAKNAGGETPALPGSYTPPGGGGGEVVKYGNNFAAAMIFAEGIGIGNQVITGEWTENEISLVDYNTSLRPVIEENASELPYFDPTTIFVKEGVDYYKQKTISTWQGQWISTSAPDEQNVTAKWGDNLISQTLNTESIVRIEMVLTKALDTNMTAYKMESLYAAGYDNEIYGTDGTTYETNTSFVFTKYASLKIERLDVLGGDPVPGDPLEDQALFDATVPDGPGKFAAEINVAGNLTYGYVWDLKNENDDVVAGDYRITFTLLPDSNVIIGDVAVPDDEEGGTPYTLPVRDSDTQVHIDITLH